MKKKEGGGKQEGEEEKDRKEGRKEEKERIKTYQQSERNQYPIIPFKGTSMFYTLPVSLKVGDQVFNVHQIYTKIVLLPDIVDG